MNTGNLLGPISKDYCLYFYLLSVIGLVLFALALFGAVYVGLSKGKGAEYFIPAIAASFVYFLTYLQNRLLYNMCAKTL
jgi:hypothetical protein